MLTFTCHQDISTAQMFYSICYWSACGWKPPFHARWALTLSSKRVLVLFSEGVHFWLWTSKGFWKLIMLCNIAPWSLPHPPPPLHYLQTGEGAHIARCWLTCSRVVIAADLLSGSNHRPLALCATLRISVCWELGFGAQLACTFNFAEGDEITDCLRVSLQCGASVPLGLMWSLLANIGWVEREGI